MLGVPPTPNGVELILQQQKKTESFHQKKQPPNPSSRLVFLYKNIIIKKYFALATGIFVLGVEVGLDLVNQLKGIGCIIVDDKGAIHVSKNIDIKKYQ